MVVPLFAPFNAAPQHRLSSNAFADNEGEGQEEEEEEAVNMD